MVMTHHLVVVHVAVHGQSTHWRVDNKASGWRRLASDLARAGVAPVGIEATGGYERGVVLHLRAKGFIVLVLQPIQVRAYEREPCARRTFDRAGGILDLRRAD
jgi:transposase